MNVGSVLGEYMEETSLTEHDRLDAFPYFTNGTAWETLESSGWDDWIAGFWPGVNWMAHEQDHRNTDEAIELTRQVQPLSQRSFNTGFRYQYSWVPAYEATGNPEFKQTALDAARRVSECFRPKISLFCNPNGQDGILRAANDAMMNIPLLLWAARHSPHGEHYRITLERYLERASKLFVKDNGAVRHRIVFDAETYAVRAVQSPQGLPGGCWARGLAWTVNGLVLGGLYLEREDFLETAERIVGFHERNTYSIVPPFDYSISCLKQPALTDTSAGAILASAMLTYGVVGDNNDMLERGEKMLKKLLHDHRRERGEVGLLGGGCFHYPDEEGINEALIWGDFYTLEALYVRESEELPLHLRWLSSERTLRAQAS